MQCTTRAIPRLSNLYAPFKKSLSYASKRTQLYTRVRWRWWQSRQTPRHIHHAVPNLRLSGRNIVVTMTETHPVIWCNPHLGFFCLFVAVQWTSWTSSAFQHLFLKWYSFETQLKCPLAKEWLEKKKAGILYLLSTDWYALLPQCLMAVWGFHTSLFCHHRVKDTLLKQSLFPLMP